MAQCDTVSMNKEKLAELSDLCKHYGMRDFVKDKIKLNDRQMFDQFANGMGNAFHAYKLNSSINRTMLNCNFKERELTAG
jgi:hypothetical protein